MAESGKKPNGSGSLLRAGNEGEARVTNLELFFDLVYVFTITQISHFMLAHSGWMGVAEGLIIFAAVWWAWMYTTWAANWAASKCVVGEDWLTPFL